MMIHGIGTDIIEIKRIEGAISRLGLRFLDKIFSRQEQDYCLRHRDSARHFAGRFAAKEAVVKALGTGFRQGITWLDVEVISDAAGKPTIALSPKLIQVFNEPQVLISISHCREYATASALIIKPRNGD